MRVIATSRGYIHGQIVEPGEEIEVTEEQFADIWMRRPEDPVLPGTDEGQQVAAAAAAAEAFKPKPLHEAIAASTPVPVQAEPLVEIYSKGGSK